MLVANGEVLPLACDEYELLIYDPAHILNALNEGASDLRRFADGDVMMITRYVFRPEVIGHVPIFRISRLRVRDTFVHQSFLDLWKASGLRGLDLSRSGREIEHSQTAMNLGLLYRSPVRRRWAERLRVALSHR
jgi:hypothetical protein